jgi:cell division protein FtsQ
VVLAVLAAVILVLGGGWLWFRDSSLVAVKRVTVTGVGGPDAAHIRSSLIVAARNMTTLHVRMDALRTAVAPFPVVKDLQVSTHFPHGLSIRVIEQIPVAAVTVGGRAIAVAGDGTLLHDVSATRDLAVISLRVPPGGSRLTDKTALASVHLLAAAPYPLLARISQVSSTAAHGIVLGLRNGPSLYFGDAGRVRAKWAAVATVLGDPGSAGAVYIDVTDPGRPAVGGVPGAATVAPASSDPTAGGAGAGTSTPGGTTSSSQSAGVSTTPGG